MELTSGYSSRTLAALTLTSVATGLYASNFIELERLGKGGYGTVNKAFDRLDSQTYAIKKISGRTFNAKQFQKLIREVQILAHLDHANILRYFHAWVEFEADEDFVPPKAPLLLTAGRELSEKSDFWGSLSMSDQSDRQSKSSQFTGSDQEESWDQADWLEYTDRIINVADNTEIFHQIVSGLSYMHQKGFIHRDIKPANIFFSMDGQIKIGDFGLSKVMYKSPSLASSTSEVIAVSEHTSGLGTPSYAAPEQMSGNQYTDKVDIFSLGIILLEMNMIFKTKLERSHAFKGLREKGELPPGLPPDLPGLGTLVLSMTNPSPDSRPSSSELKSWVSQNKRCEFSDQFANFMESGTFPGGGSRSGSIPIPIVPLSSGSSKKSMPHHNEHSPIISAYSPPPFEDIASSKSSATSTPIIIETIPSTPPSKSSISDIRPFVQHDASGDQLSTTPGSAHSLSDSFSSRSISGSLTPGTRRSMSLSGNSESQDSPLNLELLHVISSLQDQLRLSERQIQNLQTKNSLLEDELSRLKK